MPSWNRFTEEFRKDLKQWLFFMTTLSFFRVLFIVIHHGSIQEGIPFNDVIKALANGLRYDSVIATCFILVPLLLTAACGLFDLRVFSKQAKRIYGFAFIILTTTISIVSVIYFSEYNDHFNHFIFNLYYDDTAAILSTIWSDYHVTAVAAAVGALSFMLVKAYGLLMRNSFLAGDPYRRPLRMPLRIVAVLLVIILVLAGARGSFGHRPVKLEDAAITRDDFLNKAVLNPYSALMYAYTAHRKVRIAMTGLKVWLPDQDVQKAARAQFNDVRRLDDLDEYMKRTAQGRRNPQPKHVFLVVMESCDAWPLTEKYASLGLTPELGKLAAEGIHVHSFLPASDGTATSIAALVSGLADVNVMTNYQNSSRTPYPSSIAASFRRLGYRTRFFYGGYLSWQKIGDFMKGQGFEEVYGAAHIGSWASHNEWGVEDEELFDFVMRTLEPAASEPSLNMILTTSYHPPYEVDVYGKGFPVTQVPEELADRFDGSVSLRILGHLWYADLCAGNFVRQAEQKLPSPLFAFTGDHFSRKFINIHPDKFEASAVPFIVYGKETLRGAALDPDAAGSHLDIGPTLIELVAPKGFVYHSMGRSLIGSEPNLIGIGRDRIITASYLYDVPGNRFFPVPGSTLPENLPDPEVLKSLHHRIAGISWWRIMRGPALGPAGSTQKTAGNGLRFEVSGLRP